MLNPEIAVNRRPVDRLGRNPQLAAFAAKLQPFVASVLARTGTTVQDLLHGTLLGHPLHPAITDVPTGAWTVTAVLDTLELAGGPTVPGADAALVVGLAGGVGAMVTGWADWSDTTESPRTLGLAHGVLNEIAFLTYAGSLYLRRSGRRRAGLIAALAGYGVLSAAAYLGGELAYGKLIGPKHTAEPLAPADEFVPVLAARELTPGTPVRADLGGIPLLLSHTADGVAAISAICTHRGAPLDAGSFADGCVRCPWHGSTFALDTGRIVSGPASFPQPAFEARVNDDQIEVRALRVE
jgi:nitrite reductase/ring-hydroxylating ferredoxin subunit/uncharacterized membrane protein